MRALPTGTVTLLFTDIEGSTRLLHEMGPDRYAEALAEHRAALRRAFDEHHGVEVDTQGDAFFVAFADAAEAVAAATAVQERIADAPISVRMGLHTGTPHVDADGYVGADVHLGARIAAAGNGGQVLLSAATRKALAGAFELTDLGEHRLKDFEQPVWIYQVGDRSFPPLKSISNTNLPRPVSQFIGRDDEIREIRSLLRNGARLVTLTGPGGTGKTRLSLEAAFELVPDFRNGVFWVELASISDATLVVPTIASTIGARGDLAEHIAEREMLLVLDNLEQVVQAAPQLATLVSTCKGLYVLSTSRERLRVNGEIELPVAPLDDDAARELFASRTGLPADASVIELCRRLDNLPLAIELAAARVAVMSPAQIVARLSHRLDLLTGGRDATARQKTLRATIEWSFDMLNAPERRLFAGLSVFRGGWTLDAAEMVTEADLEVLASLVDKSLVQHTGERFTMLETIREFAGEQLAASPADLAATRVRHANYFLETVRQAAPGLRAESQESLDALELELDNIRSALGQFEALADDERFAEMVANAWTLWSERAPISEGRDLLRTALAVSPQPTSTRASLLTGTAGLAVDTDDFVVARTAAEEAVALYRSLGDEWHQAYAELVLGLSFASVEDWPAATDRFITSRELFDRRDDARWALEAGRRIAWAYASLGDRATAAELWREMLPRARAIGDVHGEARALSVLAQHDLDEGRVTKDVAASLRMAHRLHRNSRDQTDKYWDAVLLCRYAQALALIGADGVLVTALLAAFDTRLEQIEGPHEPWLMRMNEATRSLVQTYASGALARPQRGQAMNIEDAFDMADKALHKAVHD